MGFLDILKTLGKDALNIGTGGISGAVTDLFGAGGAAAGGYAKDAASNRDAQYAGQLDLAKLLAQRDQNQAQLNLNADNSYTSNQIARQQEGDASAQNAWRRLLSAQHTLSPSAMPNITPYAMARRQPTDAETQGANALTSEVMQRLQGGNPITPVTRTDVTLGYDPMSTVDPNLLKAGTGERLSNILGPALAFLGRPKKDKEAA